MSAGGTGTPDRKSILDLCKRTLGARKTEYAGELANLDQAAAAETKSSAGDKYETAREMIAQQRNLIGHNLAEADAHLDAIERMAAAPSGGKVHFGSLVETTLGWFLVGAALGELDIEGVPVRAISLASPMGAALKGRGAGERVPWRGASFDILRIPA
jgi:transcription elongation GreA/GreB family factor